MLKENSIIINYDTDATEAFEIVTRLLDSLNIKYDVSGEETLEIIYYPN